MTLFSILCCNSLRNCYKVTVFMNANCNLKPHINLKVRESISNCAYKYNIEIEEAINSQIQKEHQAAITYLAIAVHFLHPSISYIGAGGYFMNQYKEELQHMEMFVNYQLMRGGKPVLNEVKSENVCLTLDAAFNQALGMEKNITEHLENIVSLAEAKKDYQSADFIISKFLEHQMQCISELSHHVTVLSKLGDNQHALYHFDQHLSKSHSFSFKS